MMTSDGAVAASTTDEGASSSKTFKILVIGDYATGKTSLIKRLTDGTFSMDYKLSIGVDFSIKQVQVEDETMNLQLWDIAGHERYSSMTRTYYRYATAAIVVFDLGRPATFDSVAKWHADLNDKVMLANGDPVPAILIANKADMAATPIDEAKLDAYCSENNFLAWFATSAKTGQNIDEAIQCLSKRVLEVSRESEPVDRPQGDVDVKTPLQQNISKMKAQCCGMA